MRSFRLTVASPEGSYFEGEALMLTVRGAEGELAIMAGHVPFVTTVMPCDCKVVTEDGEERFAETKGGILTVAENKATLLSGTFRWKQDAAE